MRMPRVVWVKLGVKGYPFLYCFAFTPCDQRRSQVVLRCISRASRLLFVSRLRFKVCWLGFCQLLHNISRIASTTHWHVCCVLRQVQMDSSNCCTLLVLLCVEAPASPVPWHALRHGTNCLGAHALYITHVRVVFAVVLLAGSVWVPGAQKVAHI